MNFKKILTAATASVLAVSAMSVVAFAAAEEKTEKKTASATIVIGTDPDNNAEKEISLAEFCEAFKIDADKLVSIDKVTATRTAGSLYGGGNVNGEWTDATSISQPTAAGDWKEDGIIELTGPILKDSYFLKIAGYSAGNEVSADVDIEYTVKADENKITGGDNKDTAGDNKDTAGDNKDTAGDNKDTAGDNKDTAGDNKTTAGDNKTTGDKKPVDTGVAGVAAVVGVAVVAAGAMVVAKKRK